LDLRKLGRRGVEWGFVVQDREIWWAVLNRIMEFVCNKWRRISELRSFSRSTLLRLVVI
jgi:hypothetical protein